MDSLLVITFTVIVFGPAVVLLALFVRHGIPVVRGIKRGWTSTLLGPLALFSDRLLTDESRQHRVRCLTYGVLFMAWCVILVVGGDWLLK